VGPKSRSNSNMVLKCIKLVLKSIKLALKSIKRVIIQLVIQPRRIELAIEHIKLIKQVIRHIGQSILAIIQQLVDERFVFQLPNIQLFQLLFLKEYIQCICLNKLEECIQFNIRLHNSR